MKFATRFLIYGGLVIGLLGCQSLPKTEELSSFDASPNGMRSPAYSFAADVLASHKKQLEDPVVSRESSQFYQSLLGTWSTGCIPYKDRSAIREISFLNDSSFSQTIHYYFDKECRAKIKFEQYSRIIFETFLLPKGSTRFHGNLNWKQVVGSVTSARSQQTIPAEPYVYPFFLGHLTSTDSLLLFPKEIGRSCENSTSQGGQEWCFTYFRQRNLTND